MKIYAIKTYGRSYRFLCLFYAIQMLSFSGFSQNTRSKRLDSLYFDPFFYPTVSIIMIPKGFVEINSSTSLITGTNVFNDQSEKEPNNARTSSLNQLTQLTLGVGKKGRVNLGLDLNYNALRVDLDTESSPLKILSPQGSYFHYKAFNTAGVRVRYMPFKTRKLVFQHTWQLPLDKKESTPSYFNTQVVYVVGLSSRLFVFSQIQPSISLPKDQMPMTFLLPVSCILSYLLSPEFQIFGLGSHMMQFGRNSEDKFSEQFNATQVGLGIQYQPVLRFGVTLYGSNFVRGRNFGNFSTANLGLRFIL